MDSFFRWFGLPGSTVLTTLLSAFALTRAVLDPTPVRWTCFAAMALSSIGDVFLARPKKLPRIARHCFPIGAAFFMASHLIYALCYRMKIHAAGGHFPNTGTVISAVFGTAAFLTFLILGMTQRRTKRLPLILLYLVMIFMNCAAVYTFAWAQETGMPAAISAAVGVTCFMLSDFVIGLGLAANIHRYDALIWWLYPIGQILLILGV